MLTNLLFSVHFELTENRTLIELLIIFYTTEYIIIKMVGKINK